MKIKYEDVDLAFTYVSSMPPFTNSAYLNIETGDIYYESGYGDSDEMPDDIDDDKYIRLPHKSNLGLGKDMVLGFVSEYMPNDINEIKRIFTAKGAYARYKEYLEHKGLLKKWYEYEEKHTEAELRAWCKKNKIEIAG